MKATQADVRLSATDLARHLGCQHLSALDLAVAELRLEAPSWRDPVLEILQQRGLEHETAYLDHLRDKGITVEVVDEDATPDDAFEATCKTMRAGAEVIVQATLASGRWYGRADILRRVEGASSLGDFSYEVIDTKLARETRAGTLLQLCLYADVVAAVQEKLPEYVHVVSPGTDFAPQSFRVDDFIAYYRFVRKRLEDFVAEHGGEAEFCTYPEPREQCEICRWWSTCDKRRRDDDHLSLVAGISTVQRRELESRGVQTLEQLAGLPLPLAWKPERGVPESYERVREQARVQLESRQSGAPVYELLPRAPERGLARLPQPSEGDVFFDIEGDVFVGTAGLEYLFGVATLDEQGEPSYQPRWALDAAGERSMFQDFVDEIMKRWERYPDLHIYHYAPYEPGALKRLMGRYATREDEIDQMLRAELFVDLLGVVRQGIRAGIERYSIKNLEVFYDFEREVPLEEASAYLRALERALELRQAASITNAEKDTVMGYNRDDCVSTLRLRDWLECLRTELVEAGEEIARPEVGSGEASEALSDWQKQVRALMERLTENLPADAGEWTDEERARWILAQLLEFHRREEKATWWELFRLSDMSDEELLDDRAGLSGLDYLATVGGTTRCPIHQYAFPAQETGLRAKDKLHSAGGEPLGTVDVIDLATRQIDIKKRGDRAGDHPTSVFVHTHVSARVQADALYRLGEWVADHGVDADGLYRAARDLLLARPPRLKSPVKAGASLQADGEETVAAARRLVVELDGGVLAAQGPPGAGKTYTGARLICELVKAGKKVGVTAVSHKVIRNLLDEVVVAAQAEGLAIACMQKTEPGQLNGSPVVMEDNDNARAVDAFASGQVQVLGGTAWVWSREDVFEAADVLVVDEAGQNSLAMTLACAQGARNLVLLGDPQQLEQPQQGSHPEGTDVSALEHLLCGAKTIRPERGLFLAETWRLHPGLCAFTSELFYERRLRSRPGLENQALVGSTRLPGAGLWFEPVRHAGNQSSSPEEVDRVAELVSELLSPGVGWVAADGTQAPLTLADILIVAPYNAQVSDLQARLPNAQVGTVDKFQGQQAPVVIYSMTTSSPEEAPRGMEFLYSPHRLNVATSRARCACILVACPDLFEPECRTPRQMKLANSFCRFLEMAKG